MFSNYDNQSKKDQIYNYLLIPFLPSISLLMNIRKLQIHTKRKSVYKTFATLAWPLHFVSARQETIKLLPSIRNLGIISIIYSLDRFVALIIIIIIIIIQQAPPTTTTNNQHPPNRPKDVLSSHSSTPHKTPRESQSHIITSNTPTPTDVEAEPVRGWT